MSEVKQNFVILIFDSLRYDIFKEANLPFLKGLGEWEKSYSHGTYTGPSTLSILCGQLPTSYCRREFYDIIQYGPGGKSRNMPKLWISQGMERTRESRYKFYGKNIVEWANEEGYTTIGTGAVGWWNPNREPSHALISEFRRYGYFGNIDQSDRQIPWIVDEIEVLEGRPYFLVANFGETHVPYIHKGCEWDSAYPWGNVEESRNRQRKCIEYLDGEMKKMFEVFDLDNTNLIICADHGDCLGEDDLWGHGFYHPTVMEVPLLIRLAK